LGNGNLEGTQKLLQRGSARVRNYVPIYFGLELADFLERVEGDLELVGSDRQAPVELFQMPPIRYICLS
ncbi:MAG: hypothetical protein K8F91_21150, partial [Candidatus Obscuribacterales bacterium]|nr:hypothetical protein [Candidatus Obscuribacterales bacterium]